MELTHIVACFEYCMKCVWTTSIPYAKMFIVKYWSDAALVARHYERTQSKQQRHQQDSSENFKPKYLWLTFASISHEIKKLLLGCCFQTRRPMFPPRCLQSTLFLPTIEHAENTWNVRHPLLCRSLYMVLLSIISRYEILGETSWKGVDPMAQYWMTLPTTCLAACILQSNT